MEIRVNLEDIPSENIDKMFGGTCPCKLGEDEYCYDHTNLYDLLVDLFKRVQTLENKHEKNHPHQSA